MVMVTDGLIKDHRSRAVPKFLVTGGTVSLLDTILWGLAWGRYKHIIYVDQMSARGILCV